MSDSIAKMTDDARRAVVAQRHALGLPQLNDSGKDIRELHDEAERNLQQQKDWHAYYEWQRRHRWTWRWRTYPASMPEPPAPYYLGLTDRALSATYHTPPTRPPNDTRVIMARPGVMLPPADHLNR